MKVFRILGRSIRDSFKSVFRNFSLSLASVKSKIENETDAKVLYL